MVSMFSCSQPIKKTNNFTVLMFTEFVFILNKVTKLLCQYKSSFSKKQYWNMRNVEATQKCTASYIYTSKSSMVVVFTAFILPYSSTVIRTRVSCSFLLISRTLSWYSYPVILHHHKTCYRLCLAPSVLVWGSSLLENMDKSLMLFKIRRKSTRILQNELLR